MSNQTNPSVVSINDLMTEMNAKIAELDATTEKAVQAVLSKSDKAKIASIEAEHKEQSESIRNKFQTNINAIKTERTNASNDKAADMGLKAAEGIRKTVSGVGNTLTNNQVGSVVRGFLSGLMGKDK